MGLLRSEPMKHGTLVLPTDRARDFVDLIGKDTNMEIEDMNARDMHRPYKKYIQRIDEMERIIRFLSDEMERNPRAPPVVKGNLDGFLEHSGDYKLEEVESRLKRFYTEFEQFKENNSNLVSKRNAAREERYVVQAASIQLGHRSSGMQVKSRGGAVRDTGDEFEFAATQSLLADEDSGRRSLEAMFNNVAGVIPVEDQIRFERALFRATRGNTYTHFQQFPDDMIDPKTGRAVRKSVFVIYFQDNRAGHSLSAMSERVNKICSAFGVNTYPWPSSVESAEDRSRSLQAQEADANALKDAHDAIILEAATQLLSVPRDERSGLALQDRNSLIEEWRLFCVKEKAIYVTLNMFEGHMNLRASCWYPASEEDQIRALLIQHSTRHQSGSSAMLVSDPPGRKKQPPTFIRDNEFTQPTQELFNLYGCPRYQEANPTLFSVVTFPFLFGVMYGDVGHGLLLFLTGLVLVWKADDFKHIGMLHNARYMICMMGFFGIYCGFMYNDFFSVGFNLFGSHYVPNHAVEEAGKEHFKPDFDSTNTGGGRGPYPFGLDPVWHGATNELIFVNSLKMKLSVVIGVTQMMLGLLLRFANSIHESNMVDFFCECCPMIVFMVCFFGFMDYMILYKWVTAMPNPPSIINSLIAMGMWQKDPSPMFGDALPQLLMLITMLTVPWLLIPKPTILYFRMKNQQQQHGPGGHGVGQAVPLEDKEEDEDEHHDFGEIVIHQVIETIEYVLGTVSHTASYLRLWALSLAHQQLSFVFFQKTLAMGMSMSFPVNVFVIYAMFTLWFLITLGVLMGMDVMECVLHVLRLHWIEFDSKFYKGDGHLFVPYRHATICTDDE